MQEFSTNKLEGEKMDLQNIQDQLNTEFSKEDTQIIFWFDDKAGSKYPLYGYGSQSEAVWYRSGIYL